MATSLYIVSDIKGRKKEILAKKEWYLDQLRNLSLSLTFFNKTEKQIVEDWKCEMAYYFNDQMDNIPGSDVREIFSFVNSSSIFNITIYEESLVLSTIYNYNYIYTDFDYDLFFCYNTFERELLEFRKCIFDLISIFGGSEIIFLGDNGLDKLGDYFRLEIEEGKSYFKVKEQMIKDNVPIVTDYKKLDIKNLNYRNITEYVFDNFSDLQHL